MKTINSWMIRQRCWFIALIFGPVLEVPVCELNKKINIKLARLILKLSRFPYTIRRTISGQYKVSFDD